MGRHKQTDLLQGNTMEQYTTPVPLPKRPARMDGSGDSVRVPATSDEPSHAELLAAIQGSRVALEGKIQTVAVEVNLLRVDLQKVPDKVKVAEGSIVELQSEVRALQKQMVQANSAVGRLEVHMAVHRLGTRHTPSITEPTEVGVEGLGQSRRRISRQITLHAKACKICKLCRASLRYLESLCCQVNNAQLEIALERINASPLPRRRHASVNTRLQDERIDASPLIALERINASPLPRRRYASVNTRLQDERIDASPLPRRRRSSSNTR
ncbi:hypothetical protein NDU88_004414 [Pleurodeles waltl]|uniref:Uncharacterized protein n=1 Tax=Pleurodeles waltl TaxID=8319 RepID=A0AAV7MUU5_PLEWA|nr:hypothetical protein NDU88_004414 [Pleurodeles waltl]